MRTGYASGRKMIFYKPKYRALGTYTEEELREKVEKTRWVFGQNYTKIGVPRIEAYGRYCTKELSYESKQFGFVVISVPNVTKSGVATEFVRFITTTPIFINRGAKLNALYVHSASIIAHLTGGLLEVHRSWVTHLQPHLSNRYIEGDNVYLVDWATMKAMSEDQSERAINRSLDICIPIKNFVSLF